jgi:hypothetical protein
MVLMDGMGLFMTMTVRRRFLFERVVIHNEAQWWGRRAECGRKGGKMTRFSKLDFGQERRLISSTEGGEPYNLAQNSHRGLYRLGQK